MGVHWLSVPPPCQGDTGDPEHVPCLPHGNCSPIMPRLGPSELLSPWGHGWGLVSSYHLPGQGTGTGRADCPLRGAAALTWVCLCTDAPAHTEVSARVSMWAHACACELTRVHAHTHLRVCVCARAHMRIAMSPQHTPRGTTRHTGEEHGSTRRPVAGGTRGVPGLTAAFCAGWRAAGTVAGCERAGGCTTPLPSIG